jgi:lysophospholipase L1-like esterase
MTCALHRTLRGAVLGLALLAGTGVQATPIVKILPIGDSITQGGHLGAEYTYRLPLSELLQQEGVQPDYIGSRTTGLDPAFEWPVSFDAHHEGYYGQTTREVVRQVEAHLPALAAPDIALVHLGTNDSGWRSGSDVVAPLKSLIGELRRQNPRVAVLVALPAKGVRDGGMVLRWELWLMALGASTRDSPVVTVDQSSDAQTHATFDGVHPSPEGQRQMAGRWLQAMQAFLPKS